jgi:hypothetical protein
MEMKHTSRGHGHDKTVKMDNSTSEHHDESSSNVKEEPTDVNDALLVDQLDESIPDDSNSDKVNMNNDVGTKLNKDLATKDADSDGDDSELDDDDFDPNAKVEDSDGDSDEDDVPVPDFTSIEATTSQVRTRRQRYEEQHATNVQDNGLVLKEKTSVDIDTLFDSLKSGDGKNDWLSSIDPNEPTAPIKAPEESILKPTNELETEMITIKSSYSFAGKLVTETKQVDVNSAEAKAYLNSTMAITDNPSEEKRYRPFIPVIRKVQGTDETVELRIKMKRPSLIDKFLSGNKKQKLSTLEKSRLDWAGFVDKRSLKDELKIHNKAGYLDKQDFLSRLQAKRDVHYQNAKEQDRLRKLQSQ